MNLNRYVITGISVIVVMLMVGVTACVNIVPLHDQNKNIVTPIKQVTVNTQQTKMSQTSVKTPITAPTAKPTPVQTVYNSPNNGVRMPDLPEYKGNLPTIPPTTTPRPISNPTSTARPI
ncbi:MAG: hypothetical protein ABSB40_12895 [Nitrososphaeria archaeon]